MQSLLTPRRIQVSEDGQVTFTTDSSFPRPSAADALKSRFCKQAAVVGSAPARYSSSNFASVSSLSSWDESDNLRSMDAPADSSPFSGAVALWRNLTGKMFDIEAKLMVTASATEVQNSAVKNLRSKVRLVTSWLDKTACMGQW